MSPLIRRFLEALNGTAIAGDGVRSEGGRNYDLPCHVSGDDPAVSASRLPIRPILRTTCLQLVCGIALTSLLVAAPARADSIVFSNLGPGGTYDAGVGYNVSGPTSQAEEATAIGQPFVRLADYTFDAVDIALNWVLDTNAGTVSLASDASGQPGAVLESFTISDRPHMSSTASDLAVGMSTVHPPLRAGIPYWIVASADGDAYMSWNLNNTGAVWYGNPNQRRDLDTAPRTGISGISRARQRR